jgi:hypothetical protein
LSIAWLSTLIFVFLSLATVGAIAIAKIIARNAKKTHGVIFLGYAASMAAWILAMPARSASSFRSYLRMAAHGRCLPQLCKDLSI